MDNTHNWGINMRTRLFGFILFSLVAIGTVAGQDNLTSPSTGIWNDPRFDKSTLMFIILEGYRASLVNFTKYGILSEVSQQTINNPKSRDLFQTYYHSVQWFSDMPIDNRELVSFVQFARVEFDRIYAPDATNVPAFSFALPDVMRRWRVLHPSPNVDALKNMLDSGF